MGAALLAKAKGLNPFVSDLESIRNDRKDDLTKNEIHFEEGGHSEEIILVADLIIKSPGIPESASIIQKARDRKIEIIDELEFAYRHTKATMIAITGTNGKTTTTLLTYHLLKSAGINVGLAGNVGFSLARQVIEDNFDYYVVEVSSFQLDGMYDFKAHIAILLNITPDHLDRYNDSFEEYAASKLRITQNQQADDKLIYWNDDPSIINELAERSINSKKLAISINDELGSGAFLSAKDLIFKSDTEFTVEANVLPLIGKHNLVNSMASILAVDSIGLRLDQILSGLRSFENAPHRLEKVAAIHEVDYINDSKATNVNAVYFALDGVDSKIIWVAGGIDKGNDYRLIEQLVREKVKALICLGIKNEPLTSFFEGKIPVIHETQDIAEAVKTAQDLANNGDTVLLSPACASFDLFDNYEQRGNRFREEVIKLKSQNGHRREVAI